MRRQSDQLPGHSVYQSGLLVECIRPLIRKSHPAQTFREDSCSSFSEALKLEEVQQSEGRDMFVSRECPMASKTDIDRAWYALVIVSKLPKRNYCTPKKLLYKTIMQPAAFPTVVHAHQAESHPNLATIRTCKKGSRPTWRENTWAKA